MLTRSFVPFQVGEVVTTIPTIGFNVEQVPYKNLKFQVWDLGGQTSIRPYWRCYYSNTDAVIYVVDSADRDRVGISKQELVSMLEEEELKNAILVVLANKQDIEGAMSVTEVCTNSYFLCCFPDHFCLVSICWNNSLKLFLGQMFDGLNVLLPTGAPSPRTGGAEEQDFPDL